MIVLGIGGKSSAGSELGESLAVGSEAAPLGTINSGSITAAVNARCSALSFIGLILASLKPDHTFGVGIN